VLSALTLQGGTDSPSRKKKKSRIVINWDELSTSVQSLNVDGE